MFKPAPKPVLVEWVTNGYQVVDIIRAGAARGLYSKELALEVIRRVQTLDAEVAEQFGVRPPSSK